MHLSIGKSSLARAAAATVRPITETAPKQDTMTGCFVAVNSLRTVKGQKRPAASEDLIRSVEKHGILEPLLLAQTGEQELLLLSGSRRLAAAKAAGLESVPATIVCMSAAEASAARREIVRFASTEPQTISAVPEQTTAVGQAMPAWLL